MLSRLNISTKIVGTIVLVSLIGLVASIYAAAQMNKLQAGYEELLNSRSAAVVSGVRAALSTTRAVHATYRTMMYDDDATMQAADTERTEEIARASPLLDETAKAFPEFSADITALKILVEGVGRATAEAARLGSSNQDDAAEVELREVDALQAKFGIGFRSLRERMLAQMKASSEAMSAETNSTIFTTIAGSLAGLLLGIGVAIAIATKGITGPLRSIGQRMNELAAGNLDVVIDGQERGDEVGIMAKAVQVFKDSANENKRLAAEATDTQRAQVTQRDRQSALDGAKAEDLRQFVHAVEAGFDALSAGDLTVRMHQAVAPEFEPIRAKFNDSVAALEDTIGSVVGAVGSMRTGLNEIAVAAGDLSQRTEQQAASLEETVAALTEVTRGVNATAGDALKAQSTASIALRNAEKGGTVVARAVEAMSQIEQSSEQIGKIIGVIDEIAFQTNLLALNAGVEAARAGEAGRGFAVVAQEVRGLAQRSAEAAKEIKSLIATSSAQVEHGVELAVASGKSLDEIVAQVAEMSQVVSVIAQSSSEQSLSLKEVSAAADQMDKVTQQNAAMVEETTAAAQTLLGETDELAALIHRFRTTNASAGRSAPARAPVKTAARPSHRPVTQMRTTSAPKAAPAAETWEDF